jgi:hypothetical protein
MLPKTYQKRTIVTTQTNCHKNQELHSNPNQTYRQLIINKARKSKKIPEINKRTDQIHIRSPW